MPPTHRVLHLNDHLFIPSLFLTANTNLTFKVYLLNLLNLLLHKNINHLAHEAEKCDFISVYLIYEEGANINKNKSCWLHHDRIAHLKGMKE